MFQFNLNQTGQLLPALLNCVVSVKKNGVANAGEFAVAAKPAAAPPSPQAALSPAPKQARSGTGTGFVVSSSGHVVTNHHVIDGCSEITGNLSGEAPVKLRLVSGDETNDLALLQAPSPFKDVAKIRQNAIPVGNGVVAIGYPYHGLLTSDFTATTGIVSLVEWHPERYPLPADQCCGAARQQRRPAVRSRRRCGRRRGCEARRRHAVARATGSIPENINFAIKTGALRDFLDNSAVQYQTAEWHDASKRETSEIAKDARGFTLLITCKVNEQSAGAKKPKS